MFKRVVVTLVVIIAIVVLIFFGFVPRYFDQKSNVVATKITMTDVALKMK